MRLNRASYMAILWTLLICTSCLLPAKVFSPMTTYNFVGLDKIIHLLLYGVLVVLWSLSNFINQFQLFRLLLICILFGIGIEWAQSVMKLGRTLAYDDMIANTVGVLLGGISYKIICDKKALKKNYLPFRQNGN